MQDSTVAEQAVQNRCSALRNVIRQALPSATAQISQQLTYLITITFVAALHDEHELAACGIGTMLSNVFGLSIGVGLNSGLDTLVSQSCGALNHTQSGLYLQRAIVVSSLAVIPISFFLYFVTPILIFLHQDAKVAKLAGDLIHGTLVSMWAIFVTNAMVAFVRAQRLPRIPLYVSLASNVVHVFACYIFITCWRMGNFGAGLALSFTNWCSLVIIATYIQVVRPGLTKYSWVSWSCLKATSNIRNFLSVSLPTAFAIWAEWWCAEFMTLLAGLLGPTALAAHTGTLSMFGMLYSIAGGVQSAASTLVGNAVGAGSVEQARRNASISCAVMLALLLLSNVLMLIFAHPITGQLSGTAEVKSQMLGVLPVMLLMMSLDSLQTVIDGILRGLAKQNLMFKIKMCTMWLIRMPAAVLSVFVFRAGISGLWWASSMGMAGSLSTYLIVLRRMDWQNEVNKATLSMQQRDAPDINDDTVSLDTFIGG